ncbi:MAG: hypothetical protein M3R17_16140 [Bacteroidota bacterium]|nr:hypothetical protein [Bacteroidota bacterium]
MKQAGFVLTIFFCLAGILLSAQTPQPSMITVRGNVFDKNDSLAAPSAIILNKRTSTGQTSSPGTYFSITGLKTDTFLITSGGYEVRRICFRDSVLKETYTIRVGLQMKTGSLNAVVIYPVKDLSEIQKERAAIGKAQTRQTVGVTDAVSSPITYLYERFSREGKSREAVAILENNDNKREILKELFRTYARAGVIVMEEEEFDAFINYLNIPEDFLRTASDYDLAVFIRHKYLAYRSAREIHNRNQR